MGLQRSLRALLVQPDFAARLHAPFATGAGAGMGASSSMSSSSSSSFGVSAASAASVPWPEFRDHFVRGGGGSSWSVARARTASVAPPSAAQRRGIIVVPSAADLAEMVHLMALPRVHRVVLAGSPSCLPTFVGRRAGRPPRVAPPRAFREAVLRAQLAWNRRAEAIGLDTADSAASASRASRGELPTAAPAVAAAGQRARRSLLDYLDPAPDAEGDFTDGTDGELGSASESEGDSGDAASDEGAEEAAETREDSGAGGRGHGRERGSAGGARR